MAHEESSSEALRGLEAEIQMLRDLLTRMNDLHNYPDRDDFLRTCGTSGARSSATGALPARHTSCEMS